MSSVGSPDTENGEGASEDGPTAAVASFFSFYDFARQVADGTRMQVENLVPAGLHGHGWSPNFNVTKRIVESDAFVYGGPGFQPWADRAIETIESSDSDVRPINVRKNVEMLPIDKSIGADESVGDGIDPHFWMDPLRSKTAIDNITQAFVEIDPAHEQAYKQNATEYKQTLDEIDRKYQELFNNAPRDTVQIAAHNAFQYLAERYDTQIIPLVFNLAASGQVKPSDMERAKNQVEEENLNYLGAAVFESLRPPRQLRKNTGIKAYYPLTPFAGVIPEWVERGWGYADVALKINKPTFDIVLGNKDPGETTLGSEWRNFDEAQTR